jgi:hypothetical protein
MSQPQVRSSDAARRMDTSRRARPRWRRSLRIGEGEVRWGPRGEDQMQAGSRALVGSSLVGVEQHLTHSNENNDADDRRKEDGRKS